MESALTPRLRTRISYQAVLLGGFCTLAAALLLLGNIATQAPIEARRKEDLLASLNQVVPASYYENDLIEKPLAIKDSKGQVHTIYRGMKKGRITALAFQISASGYAGEIRLILGLDATGKILGVRVLSHAETPGLGDLIEADKSNWILGFNGLSLAEQPEQQWKVKKDGGLFDSFSGATITPRAVVQAIRTGLYFFREHRDEVLGPVPDSAQKESRQS
ncbi:MAG: electron transport complex subunit RsxG [Gammaproteobacteria bacterium]